MRVKKVSSDAILPAYHHPDDAGLDLAAIEAVTIRPGAFTLVGTGISIELPSDTEGQIRPRSGLASKHGVTVLNSPGTIDAGYRGEIKIILINHGPDSFVVRKGMKIAQLVISEIKRVAITEVNELTDSDRNADGFGSTDG